MRIKNVLKNKFQSYLNNTRSYDNFKNHNYTFKHFKNIDNIIYLV